MTDTTQSFLNLLFDKDETICVSSNKYGYHSVSQDDLNGTITLVPPNEGLETLHIQEKEINLVSINPISGFRRDNNVTKFRSFMIEMDEGTLEEQKKYIDSFKLPFSLCVFSGNKSLHFAIVLKEPLQNIDMWRFYNKWMLNILSKADQQIQNPSRSIRFPDVKRHNGKKLTQSLVSLKERVSQEDFFRWLFSHEDKKPIQRQAREEEVFKGIPDITKLPKDVKNMLSTGVLDNRNATWFYIGCRFAEFGFSMESAMGFLEQAFQEESDFSRREWEGCLASAYKRIHGDIYVKTN